MQIDVIMLYFILSSFMGHNNFPIMYGLAAPIGPIGAQGPAGTTGAAGATGPTGPAGSVTPAAAVNDATNSTDVVTQFNQLLANMRTAGLLAT